MSLALSIALCIFFDASFFSSSLKFEKIDDNIDSLIVLSLTPILKSSRIVLTIYFASSGDAEVNNSAIIEVFFPTLPFPSISRSFLKFSRTFPDVIIWLWRVDCFLSLVSFSATIPKSPIFFHSQIIFSSLSPVAFEIALITIWLLTPIFFSLYLG